MTIFIGPSRRIHLSSRCNLSSSQRGTVGREPWAARHRAAPQGIVYPHSPGRLRVTAQVSGFGFRVKWFPLAMAFVWISLVTVAGFSQEGSGNADLKIFEAPATKVEPPRSVDRYMGREVAQTMHYAGAEWLIRDEREREERCSMMLVNLGLKTGITVCDMGCGNGFYSLPIAKLVGADGQVLAVDIQAEMLTMLRERMESQGVNNISPILGSAWDPHLPDGIVDLVLMVDVYHEFSHPEEMLTAIRRSLAPGGVIVLVEYRMEDPDVPIKRLHKMSKKQVEREMTANGFELVREFDRLPWQHLLVYGIAEEKKAVQAEQAADKASADDSGKIK